MKLHDLVEGRDAPLYHFAHLQRMAHIVQTDTLDASWSHHISAMNGKVETKGTSLTRNPKLWIFGKDYRIQFRQEVLAQTNRIIPLNAEYAFRHGTEAPNKLAPNLHHRHPEATPWMEEFVVGPVKVIHRAIVEIRIQASLHQLDQMDQYRLMNDLEEIGLIPWCTKWNIPLVYSDGETVTDLRPELETWPHIRDWLGLDGE